MRFGLRRGATLAIALAMTSWIGPASSARADIFHKTIPVETPALDYRTGDQMMAPAIPGGCYTKDYAGTVHGAIGLIPGTAHSLLAKARGLCHLCGGKGCLTCHGRGLCNSCGGKGCGLCGGHKLFGHGLGHGAKVMTVSNGGCGVSGCGIGGKHGHGAGTSGGACGLNGAGCGTSYAGIGKSLPTAQGSIPSGQAFVGAGIGGVGGIATGQDGIIDPACGGKGCGMCGGLGKLFGHGGLHKAGLNDPCGSCGGKGCGVCHGTGLCDALKGLCRGCGGKGCALCGRALGILGKLCHKGEIKYFMGAGGPVPLTPGYVNWVNPVRSPRDFFAFPPFSDSMP